MLYGFSFFKWKRISIFLNAVKKTILNKILQIKVRSLLVYIPKVIKTNSYQDEWITSFKYFLMHNNNFFNYNNSTKTRKE